MRYILRFINAIVDGILAWFTPLWRRRGHEAATMVARYVRHYRPQLSEERIAELWAAHAELKEALLWWRRAEVQRLVEVAREKYADLPGFRRNALVEMVESLFVITVVFLGVRTYFIQPFRIPTNSMWPSLNGIVVHPVDEVPHAGKRLWDKITLGSSYVDVRADKNKSIVDVTEERSLKLFVKTVLRFDDGSTVSIPSASGAVMQYLRNAGKAVDTPQGVFYMPYRAGEVIMRARVDAGDMVLVNRMAYHFRQPRRGETFVFDTRGINTSSSSMKDQSGGTHFIKRLCGLPGDSLRIDSPNLLVNDRVAQEPGIARVAAGKYPYNSTGYVPLDPRRWPLAYLTKDKTTQLKKSAIPWLSEYVALGDNTLNSLDSRYWGPVRQFNILGPASFTLWPFTGHWGMID